MNEIIGPIMEGGPVDRTPIPHPITHKRKLGAFYTPLNVTTALCKWGIRTKDDIILEPCFGGCTFLEASVSQLQAMGQTTPEKSLFGCDIDPLAFQYLKTRVAINATPGHFLASDFLALRPESIGHQLVDLIIGNPPYIKHSNFSAEQKKVIQNCCDRYGIQLNGRASLWAYFVMHALHFLKPGGRIAWVLPGSFLTAQYAKKIRSTIADQFCRVAAVTLTERLFISEGTEELTVVLLAEGFKQNSSPSRIDTICLDSVAGLETFISDWYVNDKRVNTTESYPIGSGMVPEAASSLIARLSKSQNVTSFGDLATIHIGLVTGNTKYFIKSHETWKKQGIAKRYLAYILPRSRWIQGICLRKKDVVDHEQSGIPCMALDCPPNPRTLAVKAYLDLYSQKEIMGNATFSKRPIWFRFLDNNIPDAFFVFMTHLGPCLVLNKALANCTNSIYRVFFKDLSESQIKLAAISMNSTFTQLSAELIGHSRGSGALKLEPSDAGRLKLLMPPNKSLIEINETFEALDKLLRQEESDSARSLADKFLFSSSADFLDALPTLTEGLQISRDRRRRQMKPRLLS